MMIAFFTMVTTFFAGCEKDSSTFGGNTISENRLVRTSFYSYSQYTTADGQIEYTRGDYNQTDFIYSDGKLVKLSQNASGQDYAITLSYDNLGRFISYYGSESSAVYIYDGESKTPTQIIHDDGDTYYLTFEDNHIVKITGENGDGDIMTEEFTWSNGNIILREESYLGQDASLSKYKCTYSYDNHPNPFQTIPQIDLIVFFDEADVMSDNNITRYNYIEGGHTYHHEYTYQYASDGRVISEYDEEEGTTYYEYLDGTGKVDLNLKHIVAEENNDNYGYCNGGGYYRAGDVAVIKADAMYGYRFVRWSDGNTNNPRTILVNNDMNLTAIFEAQ